MHVVVILCHGLNVAACDCSDFGSRDAALKSADDGCLYDLLVRALGSCSLIGLGDASGYVRVHDLGSGFEYYCGSDCSSYGACSVALRRLVLRAALSIRACARRPTSSCPLLTSSAASGPFA
jgi:hypothetical protein